VHHAGNDRVRLGDGFAVIVEVGATYADQSDRQLVDRVIVKAGAEVAPVVVAWIAEDPQVVAGIRAKR